MYLKDKRKSLGWLAGLAWLAGVAGWRQLGDKSYKKTHMRFCLKSCDLPFGVRGAKVGVIL